MKYQSLVRGGGIVRENSNDDDDDDNNEYGELPAKVAVRSDLMSD